MPARLAAGLRLRPLFAVLAASAAVLAPAAQAGPTRDRIDQRGVIKVRVGATPGFFFPDSAGQRQGFFIDFGRSLALAVVNDPFKGEFTSSPQQSLPALQAGEFDSLLSGVPLTIARAFKLGLRFGPTTFYDGQGIRVRKDLGVDAAADGAILGIQSGTPGELNIADFFRRTGHMFGPVTLEAASAFIAALESGRVDAIPRTASILSASAPSRRSPTIMRCRPSACPRSPSPRPSPRPSPPATTAGLRSSTGRPTPSSRPRNGPSPGRMSTVSPLPRTRRSGVSSGSPPRSARRSGQIRNGPARSSRPWGTPAISGDRRLTSLGWERGYSRFWTEGGLLHSPPFR